MKRDANHLETIRNLLTNGRAKATNIRNGISSSQGMMDADLENHKKYLLGLKETQYKMVDDAFEAIELINEELNHWESELIRQQKQGLKRF